MKKLNLFLIVMLASTIGLLAQNKNYKEVVQTRLSDTINVSADKLWEIVGPGFENVSVWSTAVDHSVGSGEAQFSGASCDTRSCNVSAKGFSKVNEKLTFYDAKSKKLTYRIVEGNPGFVLLASNHWEVIDLGNNQSALKMTITIRSKKFMGTLMGGPLNKNINNLIPTIFRDLKIYAETGQISDEKKERMQKLASKS